MTPWAAAIQAQREKRNHVDDPYGYCLPPGVPRINFGGGPFKILQTQQATAILYETLVGMIFRQVFTDGRALPSCGSDAKLLRAGRHPFVVDDEDGQVPPQLEGSREMDAIKWQIASALAEA